MGNPISLQYLNGSSVRHCSIAESRHLSYIKLTVGSCQAVAGNEALGKMGDWVGTVTLMQSSCSNLMLVSVVSCSQGESVASTVRSRWTLQMKFKFAYRVQRQERAAAVVQSSSRMQWGPRCVRLDHGESNECLPVSVMECEERRREEGRWWRLVAIKTETY